MSSRLPECPLLQSRGTRLVCAAGVNFYDVGPDRAICRHCSLPESGLEAVLACEYLDLYTFLVRDDEGQLAVKANFVCLLPSAARKFARCSVCPARSELTESRAALQAAQSR